MPHLRTSRSSAVTLGRLRWRPAWPSIIRHSGRAAWPHSLLADPHRHPHFAPDRSIDKPTETPMNFAPTRRQFGTAIAAAGMAAALPTRFAFAQSEIKLKYGTAFPAEHPGSLRIKEAAEAICQDTGGTVDLQVY